MNNFKLAIVAFVMGVTVLFNIERLDFGEENFIDISSFIYILSVVAIISTLVIRFLQRLNLSQLMTFWFFAYFLGKVGVYLFSGRPVLGGVYTYLTITEVTLFAIIIMLTYWLVTAMKRFEIAFENLVFATPSSRVRQLDEMTEDIQVEMFRSRHNHHPLSIAIVEPDPQSAKETLNASLEEVKQVMLNNYVINKMANTLGKYLRRTDMILGQPEESRFIILCPDTGAKDLELLVEYVQIVAQEKLGTTVNCGVATFPGDALTFEELVSHAELNLQRSNGRQTQKNSELITTSNNALKTDGAESRTRPASII